MSSFFRSSTTSSSSSSLTPRVKTALQEPKLKNEPLRPPPLEGDQLELYDSLLAYVSEPAFEVDVGVGKDEKRRLSEAEKMWLTRECLERYLRAQKWDLPVAQRKLIDTLVWRREHQLADDDGGERSKDEGGGLNAERIRTEGKSGKDYVNGWDEDGRPLHYQVPSRNTSTDSDLNVLYCVWVMERSIDLMPPGVEKQVLLVNFSGGMSPPPLATVRGWISMLSHHYPERMEKAIAIKVPWILNAFFKVILPWIDPVTRAKLVFNAPAPWVPEDHLEEAFGGKLPFEYDQETYLPSLLKLCSERRQLYRERWVKDGSRIGASEWILKGGAPSERDVDIVEKIVESESTSVEEIHAPAGKEGVVIRGDDEADVAAALQELKV
ncbi:CRAL-TRIO domain-containing protein [Mrakia frigida]|uniref:CRAL-TRIO domain-containing protein n=1 Tax=Mrakia frigida TaxID=29902 RepID=UPI003FCC079B